MGEELRARFHEDGVITLAGAFSPEDAGYLREMLWHHIESSTPVRLNNPVTWSVDGHLGLRAVEERAVWHPVHGSPVVAAALDDIFGDDGWVAPGPPHLLLSFPASTPWSMPGGQWHVDFGFELATWPVYAVKMFALLDTVEPAGGGTLLLKGSHQLVERLESITGRRREPGGEPDLLDSDPYLKMLHAGAGSRVLLDETVEVHGMPICPVEVTGEAGDVFLTHMQVFHSPAPNITGRPRQMLGNTFARQE